MLGSSEFHMKASGKNVPRTWTTKALLARHFWFWCIQGKEISTTCGVNIWHYGSGWGVGLPVSNVYFTIAWASLTLPGDLVLQFVQLSRVLRVGSCKLLFDDYAHPHIALWLESRTQDARLQHLIYWSEIHRYSSKKPFKKNQQVRLTLFGWDQKSIASTLWLKCTVPGGPGQMQTDLQSQVSESGMPTMARHPKSLRWGGGNPSFADSTCPVLQIWRSLP